jgi:hypothetical protein
MKLYELPRGSYFKLLEDAQVPPDASKGEPYQLYKLGNIDGMYSYCSDMYGRVFHFAAWSEVEKVEHDSIQTIP